MERLPVPTPRHLLLALAGSEVMRRTVAGAPISREVVARFVAGERTEDALAAVRRLAADGLLATVDHLGEDVTDARLAAAAADAYEQLLHGLAAEHLSGQAEVSVKLTALGHAIDPELAADGLRRILTAAAAAGTTVTVDMEDHTMTDATLALVRSLRREHPDLGVVVQSYLYRTEDDVRALAGPGSRVRLCKGAYDEPVDVAHQSRAEVSRSYIRCAKVLMRGAGVPMLATHDPTLIDIIGEIARRAGRRPGDYEYQMLFGVRPAEQRRLAGDGHSVRVYVPYGTQWYGYLMRRMAERPANMSLFARALVSRS
jgi:proline dehydrogenase